MRARLAGVEVIGHRVGAQVRAAIGYVGVGLVVGLRDPVDVVGALTCGGVGCYLAASRADAGSEPGASFKQGYGVDVPAADHLVQPAGMGDIPAAYADGKLIHTDQKKAI